MGIHKQLQSLKNTKSVIYCAQSQCLEKIHAHITLNSLAATAAAAADGDGDGGRGDPTCLLACNAFAIASWPTPCG